MKRCQNSVLGTTFKVYSDDEIIDALNREKIARPKRDDSEVICKMMQINNIMLRVVRMGVPMTAF